MKIRKGFVSNSSSSSFVISKENLTEDQIWAVKNHGVVAKWLEAIERGKDSSAYSLYFYDEWKIEETEVSLIGYTSMDNLDLRWVFEEIGINAEFDKYGQSY